MSPRTSHALAELLIAARREGRQITALDADLVPASIADGYAVNDLVGKGLGWPALGWKIAATTSQMQRRLRTNEPIYGRTFGRFAMTSPARLPHAELLDPIVECEFFFRLNRDLPPRPTAYTRDTVADAVTAVHAGIEIAECRFPLDNLPPVPAILADGAASGRYVIGHAFDDWRRQNFADMHVRLSVNGQVRREGYGRDVMNDPINSLIWLANARSACGDGLASGALISTGTATGMLLARPGDVMHAAFGDTAGVAVTFDGQAGGRLPT